MEHKVTLKKIEHINHNVLHLVTNKPKNYQFTPGQATEVSIDKPGWKKEKRPFTFTNLPDDNELEFTIKVYPSHSGVTEQIEKLEIGDHLLIGDSWGAIKYKGKGSFIAGGAGVTPFLAILKDLKQKGELEGNHLFFSNHEERDIIYKKNLEAWLGDNLHVILSKEDHKDYTHGLINKESDLYKMGLPKSQLIVEQ